MNDARYPMLKIGVYIVPPKGVIGPDREFDVLNERILETLHTKYGGTLRVQGYVRDWDCETTQPSLVFEVDKFLAAAGSDYVISFHSPTDKRITRQAKWVRFAVGSDFVDIEPDYGKRIPEVQYAIACPACEMPDLDAVPDPYPVLRRQLRKNTEAFYAMNSIMVMRPRIVELLKRVAGDQIRSGPARVIGPRGTNLPEDELYWVRPIYALGKYAIQTPSKPCPRCGRPITVTLNPKVRANILDHFGDGSWDIARIAVLQDFSSGGDKQMWINHIVISGRLYWYLKQNKMRGLVGPGDDDMYFSMCADEPPLDPDRPLFPT